MYFDLILRSDIPYCKNLNHLSYLFDSDVKAVLHIYCCLKVVFHVEKRKISIYSSLDHLQYKISMLVMTKRKKKTVYLILFSILYSNV